MEDGLRVVKGMISQQSNAMPHLNDSNALSFAVANACN